MIIDTRIHVIATDTTKHPLAPHLLGLELPGRQAAAAGADRNGAQGAFLPAAAGSRSIFSKTALALYPALGKK
jgi:hypothetical protein